MPQTDIALVAHLMRRAGFGATRDELEALAEKPYEQIVDDLVHPERFDPVDEDLIERFNHGRPFQTDWVYRMVNTRRPLEEKMAFFFHHVFATAAYKSDNPQSMYRQISMFRRLSLSDFRTILVELSRDPAMLFWLDNNENHKDEPNENYGRELLELFSMGVGNYTEPDVKSAAYAFTGWTFTTNIPGKIYPSFFKFESHDHDEGEKAFLGERGRLNGEDVVDVIVRQPATARFLAKHLYNFFVADEPPVASWNETPPQDPPAIQTLVEAYFESRGNLGHIMATLLNSDFFREAQFRRVKSPTEVITSVAKLLDTYRIPDPSRLDYGRSLNAMGQSLMNPATVEGWHTGLGWIDGGTLNERVNFAVNEVEDIDKPGIRRIIERLESEGRPLQPEEFVARCLDLVGPIVVRDDTLGGLLHYAVSGGPLVLGDKRVKEHSEARVVRMLQLIVSTREYQFC